MRRDREFTMEKENTVHNIFNLNFNTGRKVGALKIFPLAVTDGAPNIPYREGIYSQK